MASLNNEKQNYDVNKTLEDKAQKLKYGLIHSFNAKFLRENLLMFIMDVQ